MGLQHLSRQLMQRCDELGAISDEPGRLTRTFNSPAMARANSLVGTWMAEAGLETREDPAFNLIGRWRSRRRGARTLLLGSHLDTVRDAGKYDGPLGVLAALGAVAEIKASGVELPFHVEVIGFSDEEGVRYQTTYLGSRALAGTLTPEDLSRIGEEGIEKARRRASEFLGYVELHIEQGPVLEAEDLAVGVVSGIAGQSRIKVEFHGKAGHAGTTPLKHRKDALCAASEFILEVEQCGVTATVGQIEVSPGASNVIPARAVLTLDVRDFSDAKRRDAVKALHVQSATIASRRRVRVKWEPVQETAAVECDPDLTEVLTAATAEHQPRVITLPSGAGHDAAALSAICPVAMVFVRCKGGLSHHPAESVKATDAGVALAVLASFIRRFAALHA